MKWEEAGDLKIKVVKLLENFEFKHIDEKRIFCFRSYGASSRAIARIWAFPKIFQQVLKVDPAYVIEVISEKFNRLNEREKIKVFIHELLHIPKNFSGSLLPHKYGKKRIDREVERIFRNLNI